MSETPFASPLATAYIERLAAPTPTPGGGSAAAIAGGMATALLEMIASVSRKSVEGESAQLIDDLMPIFTRSREVFIELGSEDESAYGGFRDALALPKRTAEEKATRKQSLEAAAIAASAVPLEIAELALELLQLVPALQDVSSHHLDADLTVCTALLGATINSAVAMVNANLPTIKDPDALDEVTDRIESLLATFTEIIEAEWEELEDETEEEEENDR